MAPFLLRRTKDDPTVAPELPPRVERVEYPPLTAEQAALYRAVVEQLERDWRTVADPNLRRGLILAALTRLKLILDHPALYLKEDGTGCVRSVPASACGSWSFWRRPWAPGSAS